MRLGQCSSCGKTFEHHGTRGAVPKQCKSCKPPKIPCPERRCEDCGTIIKERGQRGPVAKRCKPCQARRAYERQKDRIPSRSIRKECEHCGNEYMTARKRQKFCSNKCRAVGSRSRVILVCQNEGCGKTFEVPSKQSEARRFCSHKCWTDSVRSPPKICLHCGEEFSRRVSESSRDSGLYCGKSCFFAAVRMGKQAFKGKLWTPMRRMISWFHDWADEGAKAARATERAEKREPCAECGKECEEGRKFCSRDCLHSHRVTKKCPSCGVDVHDVSIFGLDPLCSRCSSERARESRRRSKRSQKKKHGNWRRRCRNYGGYFNPAVKRDAIFERDGYRCHVCKRKLPKRFSHDNPRSPTVDHHPVPLSKGGDHDWHNVRCCCWECNVRKGASWDGQMLLTLPPPDPSRGGSG